jgi:hypothetical protein
MNGNRRSFTRRGRPARHVCVEVIRGLHDEGYSFRAIARCTGAGYGTVRRAFHGLAPLGADPAATLPRSAGRPAGQASSNPDRGMTAFG